MYLVLTGCKVHKWTNKKWRLRNIPFKHLSPHDALKHHFTSLKTNLFIIQLRVLEWKFPWNCFSNYVATFFNISSTSSHLHPLQVENCDSNSRLVVDEDENDKFRLEKVKASWKKEEIKVYGINTSCHCHINWILRLNSTSAHNKTVNFISITAWQEVYKINLFTASNLTYIVTQIIAVFV